VDTAHFARNGIELNDRGFPQTGGANESSVQDVYIAGDCRAGAATVVKAIADGKTIAADILRKLGLPADFAAGNAAAPCPLTAEREQALYAKKGVLAAAGDTAADGSRCLSCAELCEICVDVCPNRANVLVRTGGAHQVVHIDRICNECGNCAVFCPHGGLPYRDKFTVFKTGEDFAESDNPGFLLTGEKHFKVRLEDKSAAEYTQGDGGIPGTYRGLIKTIMENYPYYAGR
jgi:putative selenate reductase